MEKFFSEIKNTADKVAKKSGELVELSKVKLNILNTKSNIDTAFKSLGELIYRSQKDEDENSAEKLEALIADIDALYEKLSDYEDVVADLTNKKICPDCHKSTDNNAQFCSHCGYNFE